MWRVEKELKAQPAGAARASCINHFYLFSLSQMLEQGAA